MKQVRHLSTGIFTILAFSLPLCIDENKKELTAPLVDNFVMVSYMRGFEPQVLKTTPGSTVTWYTKDGGHSATADDGSFDTGDMWPGAYAFVTFNNTGTYPYHCMHHPKETGVIIVEDPGIK